MGFSWKQIDWKKLAFDMVQAAPSIIRDAFAVKQIVDSNQTSTQKASAALLAADDVAKHLDGAHPDQIDAAAAMGEAIIGAFQTQPPVPEAAQPAPK